MKKSKDKILIFGNGQIGNFYLKHFKLNAVISQISPVDITQLKLIEKAINKFKPTVVINTAAKTNLEWCANNKLEAFNVNVLGADNIARVCDEKGIYFIQLSSGCILASKDEKDAKKETDIPLPISYYSWTKVWSEDLITFNRSKGFKYLILRPRQPVSAEINYKNMLLKMLTFRKFIDTPNSGTVLEDLMVWTTKFIEKRTTGIVHVANKGWTTPYQIGLLLKKYILPDLPVNKISKEELNKLTPEKRVDTVLNINKLEKIVGPVKSYNKRLEELMFELKNNFDNSDKKILREQMIKTVTQSKTRTVINDVWEKLL
jgi:dTDP-4-dehydrorhamnose reductase